MRRILPVLLCAIAAPALAQTATPKVATPDPASAPAATPARAHSRFGVAIAELTRVARERAAAQAATSAPPAGTAATAEPKVAHDAPVVRTVADSSGG
ncbi:hypothetical protein [Lysobacter xanthus]